MVKCYFLEQTQAWLRGLFGVALVVGQRIAANKSGKKKGSAQFVRLGCLQVADCKCPKKAFILTNWALPARLKTFSKARLSRMAKKRVALKLLAKTNKVTKAKSAFNGKMYCRALLNVLVV